MSDRQITYQAIGTIHSPFRDIRGMPIQPTGAAGIQGSVDVLPQFVEGLRDLAGFSHIILVYHFHLVREVRLTVTPFLDSQSRGLFATRAPKRPNPIGLSVVKLLGVDGHRLEIENVDIVDGTPLLDIKPYVPQFDHHLADRVGWLQQAAAGVQSKRSDERFQ